MFGIDSTILAFVALAGLRKWWFVIPALLAMTAVSRMVFAPGT